MSVLSFFSKPKQYLTPQQMAEVVAAIRDAEKRTSGEIRVYIEGRNPMVDPVDRAREVFYKLKMQQTEHHNAVLLYMAMKDQELALFGDEGIHTAVGAAYWQTEIQQMVASFKKDNISQGICGCVHHIGQTLKEKFPYEPTTDKNELPDDIVFGK